MSPLLATWTCVRVGVQVLPQVVGFKLTGAVGELLTATDLVLTITEILRKV